MLTTNYSRNKANQSMKSYTDNQKIATLTPLYEGIRTDLIKAFDEIVITDKRRESYILDVEFGLFIYEYFKENGFLKPVQVEALKNYPNLSNVTQFSVISIMNDALPKKSKENLNPDIHEKNGEENKITIPEGVDPELLMKVLGNPEMAALLTSLAKTMKV